MYKLSWKVGDFISGSRYSEKLATHVILTRKSEEHDYEFLKLLYAGDQHVAYASRDFIIPVTSEVVDSLWLFDTIDGLKWLFYKYYPVLCVDGDVLDYSDRIYRDAIVHYFITHQPVIEDNRLVKVNQNLLKFSNLDSWRQWHRNNFLFLLGFYSNRASD